MMYYITYVFSMAGLTGNNMLVSSSIQYVINVVMTIPALIWIDKWGRRPMFLVGACLMMIWLFINAGVMAMYGHAAPAGGLNGIAAESWVLHGPPAKVVIAMSYLFVATFAPTWGPASWAYPPELFPLRVRGKAVALSTSANVSSPHSFSPYQKTPNKKIKSNSFCSKVGIQLRPWLLRPPSLRKHPMESLHPIRSLLRHDVHPRILHLS